MAVLVSGWIGRLLGDWKKGRLLVSEWKRERERQERDEGRETLTHRVTQIKRASTSAFPSSLIIKKLYPFSHRWFCHSSELWLDYSQSALLQLPVVPELLPGSSHRHPAWRKHVSQHLDLRCRRWHVSLHFVGRYGRGYCAKQFTLHRIANIACVVGFVS